jgi:hypothetical protein
VLNPEYAVLKMGALFEMTEKIQKLNNPIDERDGTREGKDECSKETRPRGALKPKF